MDTMLRTAQGNFARLTHSYFGRALVAGKDKHGEHLIQIAIVTARSEANRNRVLFNDQGRVFTHVADPAKKVGDPSITLYPAMNEWGRFLHVASNGSHTDEIVSRLRIGDNLCGAVMCLEHENDSCFTPRIAVVCTSRRMYPVTAFAIVAKNEHGGCKRVVISYEDLPEGFGRCVMTYAGDGDPPPTFFEEPMLVPLVGNISAITRKYWNALNPDHRVAIAAKFINIKTGESEVKIINRHNQN